MSCSGGADSTALFHLLCEFAKREKSLRLAVGHVGFGLRGEESDEDLRFSRALAEKAGVPFKCVIAGSREKAQKTGKSTQEWARDLRREAYAAWAAEGWATALGHHADDQAETVLMRLARGAAPGALLGMRAWKAPVWRPLLGERKADLVAWMRREGHAWREDRTNAEAIYARNVIRNEVLPALERLYPGAAGRIVACAEEAAAPLPALPLLRPSALPRSVAAELHTAEERKSGGAEEGRANARRTLAGLIPPRADGRPRQLSRAWLDQAAAVVATGEGALTVPGGDYVLVAKAGVLSVTPVSGKRDRRAQHAASLAPPLPKTILESGASASMRISEEQVLPGESSMAGEGSVLPY